MEVSLKKALRFLFPFAAGAVVLLAAGLGWLVFRKPAMHPPSTLVVERTVARIERGRYLTHHVADCFGCHSDHVENAFGFPPKPGTLGQGGFPFDEKLGIPGLVCAQNITPDPENGIGKWTDGEVIRAIREGVDRTGRTLFPMMPYKYFHEMSDEDVRSVVAYLRTMPAIQHRVPVGHIAFPVNLLIKSAPKPVEHPIETPDDSKDHFGYGKYLVTIGGCRECHTAHDSHGQLLPGRDFAGGWVMKGPWGTVVTANITPDAETFVGQTTRESFINRFRAFRDFDPLTSPTAPKGRNTIMPWLAFSHMTDQDLAAIFDFLKTVPPIRHKVERFPDAEMGTPASANASPLATTGASG